MRGAQDTIEPILGVDRRGAQWTNDLFAQAERTVAQRATMAALGTGTHTGLVVPFGTAPFLDLRTRPVLAPGGACVSVDDGRPNLRRDDLVLLGALATKGEVRPVIDRTYALDSIVEAHTYVDNGHKRGNVVVSVA